MAKNMAVFFGSRSCEHDVSIISAVQWMANADPEKYTIIPVYLAHNGGWYAGQPLRKLETFKPFKGESENVIRVLPDLTGSTQALLAYEERPRLFGSGKPKVVAKVDVAVPIFHGLNGEDGSMQGVLELMNVPYTSSGLVGSAVGMDKIAMKQLFQGCGFPVLNYVWFTRGAWDRDAEAVLSEIEREIQFPCFVKPANLGSSIGISKARDQETLHKAMEVAFSYDRRVLVEPGVEQPLEINCSAMGFEEDVTASVCEMPVSWEDFLTFEEKYIAGNTKGSKGGMVNQKRQIPAPIGDVLTKRIQGLTRDIFRSLDCKGVVRVDFLIDQSSEALYVNEINTIPGSLAYYLWEPIGVPYPQLIEQLVSYAEYAHAEKNRASFGFDSTILQSVSLGGVKK